MIKKIVHTLVPKAVVERVQRVREQIRNFRSLARDYGQWATIRDRNSVDEFGNPIPWYTYPTTEYLSHFNFEQFSVFEFGSGNSTLWWAGRCQSIDSVEDDQDWHAKISKTLISDSASYLLETEKDAYISSASAAADIFVIDGKHRRECAEEIVKICGGGVMIILDNSDWYPKTATFLRDKLAWVQIDFHGFGPINNYTWTTSIFLNPIRHQELIYSHSLKPKCGLVQVAAGDY